MCYVNALFVVQPNAHCYSGGELTMGRGYPMAALGKPELNTKSLCHRHYADDVLDLKFPVGTGRRNCGGIVVG